VIGVYGRGVEGEHVTVSFAAGDGDADVTALGDAWQPIEAGPNRGYRTTADSGSHMIWLTMGDGIVRIEGGAVPVEELTPFAAAVTRGDDGRYTLTPPDGWQLDEERTAGDDGAGSPATTTTAGVGD
jgi:hypothetical protein